MQSWQEGRIWVGKGAQATGMTASLRILSSKADSNTWESFTRSGLKLESVHQESPRSDLFRKRATKPLLNQRQRLKHLTWAVEKNNWTVAQWSKVLFSDESKFCISFENQGPRVWRKSGEAQIPCCLKSSVKFPQSVMIWAAMSSAGVGPLCFLKSTVNAAIYQEILEHFMLPSTDKLYGDADFIFQQDLAPAHTAKGTKSWFNDHGVTVLDWPTNSPDLNPIEKLGRSPYQVLSTYTVNEHTFQKANNSLKMFFLLVLWSILICWDWWVFVKCEPKSSQLKEPKT